MSVSPFDHPLLAALLGDDEVSAAFSVEAEIAAILAFERALAEAEVEAGLLPKAAAEAITAGIGTFAPHMADLHIATARDGVVVPELVRQLRAHIGDPQGARLHFGATSQDAIDTGLMLRLKPVLDTLDTRLRTIIDALEALGRRSGTRSLIGVTRMQPAIGITVADRLATWQRPLKRHLDRLAELRPRLLTVQLGGAAGTLDSLGEAADAVRAALARKLELGDRPQWHSQRDTIAEFAGWLSLVTASLGKIGADVAQMAFDGSAIQLRGSGGSSSMPHKQNPVRAEILEALARFNAVQVSALHQAIVHPTERSGMAWTLEWLVLPQMVVAAAAALSRAAALIHDLKEIGR